MADEKDFWISNNDMFKKHISKLFATTIATIEPKIEIKNEQVQKEWEKLKSNNNLLEINYQLVSELSKNGIMTLMLTTYFDKEKPKIVVAKPIYVQFAPKLKLEKIVLQFYLPIFGKNDYNINCTLNLSVNYKYTFQYFEEGKFVVDHIQPYTNYFFSFFKNNPEGKSDLDNVNPKWVEDYNKHLDMMLADSLTSKSLFHLNQPNTQGSMQNVKNLKETLYDPSAVIFENKNIFSLLQSGGLQIQQGLSQSVAIIEKLKFYDNKIKEYSFSPRNTLDAGTKNIHSAEANQINSQSDDYIEIKANLLEMGWEEFIRNVFFDYLSNNVDEFKNFNFDDIEIDVEISGSTKYLKNQENEYLQNQQGTLVNPNKINIQETEKIDYKKATNNESKE